MDFDFFGTSHQSRMDYANMIVQTERLPEAHGRPSFIDFSAATAGSSRSPSPLDATPNPPPICVSPPMQLPGYPPYVDGAFDSKQASIDAMREMIFRIAAMQPIHIDPEAVKPPKRRNVKISKDPQSVAARHRRERISERIRILQRLVPGGTKMDTASMLDEAIHYVKFLKDQVQSMEHAAASNGGAPRIPEGNYQYLAEIYQQICEDQAQLQQYMMR